jgi:hypothetical protein
MRQSETRYTAILWFWLIIFVWCTIWIFTFYMMFRQDRLDAMAIAGLAVLLGIYIGWRGVRFALDLKKFGDVSLTPRLGAPARPGGRFVGLLRFQDKFPAMPEVEAEIRCQRVTWRAWLSGKTSRTEEVVWSRRERFPLRRRGLGAGAEISFDIPADARPTDLAEEHSDEFDRFSREGGEARHFHRWEIAVVAQVPGIDLDRDFAIVIEPDPATAAPEKQESVVAAPPVPSIHDSKWYKRIFALVFLVVIFFPFGLFLAPRIIAGSPALGSLFPASWSTAEYVPPPEPVLPPKTPWITDTRTWSMPMQEFAPYLGIAANGIRRTRVNGQERFSFDEIVIEKNPGRAEVTYLSLGINVTYHDTEVDDTRSTGGFSRGLQNIQGKLTAENPVLVLRNLSIESSSPKGHIARTRISLAINAVSGQLGRNGAWKQVHEVSRHFTGR